MHYLFFTFFLYKLNRITNSLATIANINNMFEWVECEAMMTSQVEGRQLKEELEATTMKGLEQVKVVAPRVYNGTESIGR